MIVLEDLSCRPLAATLREFGRDLSAWVIEEGIRDPKAIGAVRADIDAADLDENPGARRALHGLVDCYARREEHRVLHAIAAWDRRGCAACAARIAITDERATCCADCADLDEETRS